MAPNPSYRFLHVASSTSDAKQCTHRKCFHLQAQALYGDSFVLEYDGNDNGKSGVRSQFLGANEFSVHDFQFILVDGGPSKRYPYPARESTQNFVDLFNSLSVRTDARKLEFFDTAVVTHDDMDHKNGTCGGICYHITLLKHLRSCRAF